jgi:serine/threonine protein kinase/predicted Zn-dependent protease
VVESTVGPYRILGKIGSGGMGDVYLAEDPRLERHVALKTLTEARLGSPDARDRLLREARAVAQLNHPGIAAIYDVVEAGARTHIVMEYVEGEPLSSRLRHGRFEAAEATSIGIELCDAVAAAHGRGVVHRDLKPANVVLTPEGHVKVLDFGLAMTPARLEEAAALAAGDATTPSHPPRILGTPAYMAPEVLRGPQVDHRSDIYSIGVMLFELLTAQRPFKGADVLELGVAILTEPAPPPASLVPDVPAGLSAVVARAMARDPAERFQSALEMRQALARLPSAVAEQPTRSAAFPWSEARLRWRLWRRRLAAAAGLGVLGLAALALWRGEAPSAPFSERSFVLIADFDDDTGQPLFADSLREGLSVALSQSSFVNLVPRPRVREALARMRRDPSVPIDGETGRELCVREGVPVLLSGAVRRAGKAYQIQVHVTEAASGRLLFAESERFEQPDQVFEGIDALAQRVRRGLGESVTRIEARNRPLARATTRSLEALQLYSKARELALQGQVREAAALLRRALELDADFALAHVHLAHLDGSLGDEASALDHYQKAYLLGRDVTRRERSLIEAAYHKSRGEYERAADCLQQLLATYPDDVDGRQELALAYDALGRFDRAAAELRQVVRLDPYATQAYGNLGLMLVSASRFGEAVTAYDEARRRDVASSYFGWGLGLARLGLGDHAAAVREFTGLVAAGPPYDSIGRLYLARAAAYRGHLDDAERRLAEALSAAGSSSRPLLHALRARLLWMREERSQARTALDALLAAEAASPDDDALRDASQLLAAIGEQAPARRAVERLRARVVERPQPFVKACLAMAEGELALANGQPAAAAELFAAASASYPHYAAQSGLARSYEALGDWRRAVEAWERVLASQGEVLRVGFPPDWPLALRGAARGECRAGNCAKGLEKLDALHRLWQDADERLRRAIDAERVAMAAAAGAGKPQDDKEEP